MWTSSRRAASDTTQAASRRRSLNSLAASSTSLRARGQRTCPSTSPRALDQVSASSAARRWLSSPRRLPKIDGSRGSRNGGGDGLPPGLASPDEVIVTSAPLEDRRRPISVDCPFLGRTLSTAMAGIRRRLVGGKPSIGEGTEQQPDRLPPPLRETLMAQTGETISQRHATCGMHMLHTTELPPAVQEPPALAQGPGLGHSDGRSTSRYSAPLERIGWTTGRTSPARTAPASTPWTIRCCLVICCHARSALLRRGLLPAARPLLSHGHPTWRRRWADALPRAGRLARVLAATEGPPLPDRGRRRPPASPERGQGPHRRRVSADAAWPAATWVTRKEHFHGRHRPD